MRSKRKHTLLCLCGLLFAFPINCYANGGGPVLLIYNTYAFSLGQVWIILAETYVIRRVLQVDGMLALSHAFWTNLASTFAVGIGFPLLLAVLGGVGSFLPEPAGGLAFVLGTWVAGDSGNGTLLLWVCLFWLAVSFYLTVIFERWFLIRRISKKGLGPTDRVPRAMILSNVVSYTGLLVGTLVLYLKSI